MRPHTLALLSATLAVASFGASAQASPRAVIELFTSQGCSSCPPADKLFVTLARDPDLITLSLPVDYWDRLGWKDTFAKHAFTERQSAYAGVRGDGQIYTPQAVVNGAVHVNGADRLAIDEAISETARLSVPVSAMRVADTIAVSVGASTGKAQSGTVLLLPLLAARDVAIGRGENARAKVTYTNIVRDIVPIGVWNGGAVALSVPLAAYKDYDGMVVLLQAGSADNPGPIIGATRVRFDERAEALSPSPAAQPVPAPRETSSGPGA
jgi:hypothetical protein